MLMVGNETKCVGHESVWMYKFYAHTWQFKKETWPKVKESYLHWLPRPLDTKGYKVYDVESKRDSIRTIAICVFSNSHPLKRFLDSDRSLFTPDSGRQVNAIYVVKIH